MLSNFIQYRYVTECVICHIYKLLKLSPDGPQHEDDRSHNCKGQSIGEMPVEGELDHVAPQTECACSLCQGCEDPETDGRLQQ